MVLRFLALAPAVLAALSAPATSQTPPAGDVIFEDRQSEVTVRYAFAPGTVLFSADLPAGWTFSVSIDGDRNGRWGNGPESGQLTSDRSGDRTFGQDSRNGVLCAQYILTTAPGDPERIYASSECNAYPSQGRVEMTQLDARERATITYRIPSAEVFGPHGEARLRVCVWNGRQNVCQHSLARPFVLRDPGGVTSG